MNPLFLIDFYKVGHVSQYPKGTTQIFSNWTARKAHSSVAWAKSHVFFGLTYFLKKYLRDTFQREFFDRPLRAVLREYSELIHACLGVDNPKVNHLVDLHNLGYLPLRIYALPEGANVPFNVPSAVITNTHPEFFWLPNYIESLWSNILWKPSTSATIAQRYRRLFLEHARRAGEANFDFVDWQGHDFSYRGMSGSEDAILSGMGHLLSFSGTDTVPAIVAAQKYYNAPAGIGGSVPATEHSVMCASLQSGEFELFKKLITEIYPSGIISIVSDTWDLWKVLTDYIPALRNEILNRPPNAFGISKVVIRPDSGDPVNIVCGDSAYAGAHGAPQAAGAMRLLAQALGTVRGSGPLPMIDHGAIIYGDAITLDRADKILTRTIDELKLSPYNMVFGIGSFTYEYVTRDTFGFALKATAARFADDSIQPLFKRPVTDDGTKFSHVGIPAVFLNDGKYEVLQNAAEETLDYCAFEKVFENGQILVVPTFNQIRERVKANL